MFKIGDKVVCIDDYCHSNHGGGWGNYDRGLKLDGVYTVKSLYRNSSIILEGDLHIVYSVKRFISFTELRRKKIECLIQAIM